MKDKLIIFITFASLLLAGCANAWRTTYVTSATTAKFVTTAHQSGWSEPLNETKDECLEKLDPETNTKSEFDECMGLFAPENNAKVVKALELYDAKARVVEEVLKATDPNDPAANKDKLYAARRELLDAAVALISLFPQGAAYVDQFKLLTDKVK